MDNLEKQNSYNSMDEDNKAVNDRKYDFEGINYEFNASTSKDVIKSTDNSISFTVDDVQPTNKTHQLISAEECFRLLSNVDNKFEDFSHKKDNSKSYIHTGIHG